MALVALYQRYGRDTGPFHYTTADQIAARRAGDGADLDRDDAWLLGDSAQITFATPQELEQLVERAVERPVWRDNISEAIARRARERYTTDRFAQRIIDLVRSSFE
jgi:glycosyltransferase involved in cell wall biosynthesis